MAYVGVGISTADIASAWDVAQQAANTDVTGYLSPINAQIEETRQQLSVISKYVENPKEIIPSFNSGVQSYVKDLGVELNNSDGTLNAAGVAATAIQSFTRALMSGKSVEQALATAMETTVPLAAGAACSAATPVAGAACATFAYVGIQFVKGVGTLIKKPSEIKGKGTEVGVSELQEWSNWRDSFVAKIVGDVDAAVVNLAGILNVSREEAYAEVRAEYQKSVPNGILQKGQYNDFTKSLMPIMLGSFDTWMRRYSSRASLKGEMRVESLFGSVKALKMKNPMSGNWDILVTSGGGESSIWVDTGTGYALDLSKPILGVYPVNDFDLYEKSLVRAKWEEIDEYGLSKGRGAYHQRGNEDYIKSLLMDRGSRFLLTVQSCILAIISRFSLWLADEKEKCESQQCGEYGVKKSFFAIPGEGQLNRYRASKCCCGGWYPMFRNGKWDCVPNQKAYERLVAKSKEIASKTGASAAQAYSKAKTECESRGKVFFPDGGCCNPGWRSRDGKCYPEAQAYAEMVGESQRMASGSKDKSSVVPALVAVGALGAVGYLAYTWWK